MAPISNEFYYKGLWSTSGLYGGLESLDPWSLSDNAQWRMAMVGFAAKLFFDMVYVGM